jgi:hypothetical protein
MKHTCDWPDIEWDGLEMNDEESAKRTGICSVCGQRVTEMFISSGDLYDADTGGRLEEVELEDEPAETT